MSNYRGASGPSKLTHYETLGLRENCSQNEIKSAFLTLSKKYHPDMNSSDPGLHNKFVKINEAYSVLRSPGSRHTYDVGLRHPSSVPYGVYTYNRPPPPPGPDFREFGSRMSYDEFVDFQQRRRRFYYYDPTIDPSRTGRYKSYNENAYSSYYGIRGIPRQPNMFIVGGCFVFILVGAFVQALCLTTFPAFNRSALDEQSAIYTRTYNETRKTALENGLDKQVEMFEKRMANNNSKRVD